MSKAKCVVPGCGKDADWRTRKKGLYPYLCDKCLDNLPNAGTAIDSYTFIDRAKKKIKKVVRI